METSLPVSHQTLVFQRRFEDFTTTLESLLGPLNPASLALVATDPERATQELATMGGYEDLVLFEMRNHGELLQLLGTPKKAKQYEIGNPLLALKMTQHDLRAALYAPLRVLVYEAADQQLQVEYDLPSSLFGQFQNAAVTAVAQRLDTKLLNLLRHTEALTAAAWA